MSSPRQLVLLDNVRVAGRSIDGGTNDVSVPSNGLAGPEWPSKPGARLTAFDGLR